VSPEVFADMHQYVGKFIIRHASICKYIIFASRRLLLFVCGCGQRTMGIEKISRLRGSPSGLKKA